MTIKARILSLFRRRRKDKHRGDFVRRRRYRLAFDNVSALSTVWQMRFSRRGLILAAVAAFALCGLFWFMVFVYTPLRGVLPVGMSYDLREDYDDMSLRLDSIIEAQRITEAYTANIERALQLGDSADVEVRAEAVEDAPKVYPLDSLLEASAAERSFVSRFEQAERYNLSVLAPIVADGMTFFPPVSGMPVDERVSDAGIPSIAVKTTRATPVSAIYRGTVVNSYYTTGRGLTLVVQHPNDFMSIYSGLAETFATRGDKVSAGTRLGLASGGNYPLTFELWHNGSPLPPQDYVIID